ncbi:non-homologous end joining protein Ku [Chitinophaga japonensis]|uniref:Non-homologous end joining protein Ku n=1 Tax=Chitinophaga japonensis TaxID=104662 RepID=A0A562TFV2_CHIJA|nr:Ku protein [Chitinophaga japonensis]TWI91966.1 DNA end-binding protein Ku [Chitinophaga japonensis]
MRSIWSGTIGFGLVNIPVKLYSAVQESRLDLDMLDRKNHARIRYQRVNEDTGKEVPWDQIVKGYLYNDEYVILEEADFEDASPKKSKIIEIEAFVKESEIDDIYFEMPYFIEPDKGGAKAYELLMKTLQKTGKVGLSRFVLRSREHLAVVRPRDNYLLLQQLRFEQELRNPEDLSLPDSKVRINKKELDMAEELVKQYSAPFDISQYKDEYTAELMKIIKAKASGKRRTVRKMKVVHTKSDDLFNQLKASLSGGGKKRAS